MLHSSVGRNFVFTTREFVSVNGMFSVLTTCMLHVYVNRE